MSGATRALFAGAVFAASLAAHAAPPAADVTRIPAEQVRAGFAKGMPLLENDAFKIHASRRDAAGSAEVHLRDTDTIFVQAGSATFVTGGRVVDPKTVAPDEIRGASIEAASRGSSRRATSSWCRTACRTGSSRSRDRSPTTSSKGRGTNDGAGSPRVADGSEACASRIARVVDLMTADGASQVGAQWRHADVNLVETMHRAPDADGPAERRAGEDVGLRAARRRCGLRRCVVARAGSREDRHAPRKRPALVPLVSSGGDGAGEARQLRPEGCSRLLRHHLDDYAEVWVDGALARSLGQVGGSVIAGWNARNHVLLTRSATPGQKIQIAVFARERPALGSARELHLDARGEARLRAAGTARAGRRGAARAQRRDRRGSIPRSTRSCRRIRSSTKWRRASNSPKAPSGCAIAACCSSAIPTPTASTSTTRAATGRSACSASRAATTAPTSPSTTSPARTASRVDPQGRLTNDEHGRRRVVRLEADGTLAVLADRYEGKRLNSPNDLVYRSDGTLFFTDPFFGLPKFQDDPRRELDFAGVYAWKDGNAALLTQGVQRPERHRALARREDALRRQLGRPQRRSSCATTSRPTRRSRTAAPSPT